MDPEKESFRKDVYGRLERDEPRRWERMKGCAVTHTLYGAGTISKVMMPDWNNPVHLAVTFGAREKTFYLSSFGDRTKFPTRELPEALAEALDAAEEEIGTEERQREETIQRRERELREAALQRKQEEAARLEQLRQAVATREATDAAQAEAKMAAISDKIVGEQQLTADELRLLLAERQHEVLQGYHARAYARTRDHRAIVRAATAWRAAKQPEYALRVTELLMDDVERLSPSARAAVFMARGGALLDLQRLPEARQCALQARAADGKSPQPDTPLGALLGEVASQSGGPG